ncbi:unnamed protein product, partial [Didymodactylos carnosus]
MEDHYSPKVTTWDDKHLPSSSDSILLAIDLSTAEIAIPEPLPVVTREHERHTLDLICIQGELYTEKIKRLEGGKSALEQQVKLLQLQIQTNQWLFSYLSPVPKTQKVKDMKPKKPKSKKTSARISRAQKTKRATSHHPLSENHP